MTLGDNAEATLCARSVAGDRSAFESLVRMHQAAVRKQLRRLCKGDDGLADDLAQESFLQAWHQLKDFRGEAKFSSWLYRIAYHRYLMYARSAHPTEPLPDEDITMQAASYQGDRDHARQLDVASALAQLPEGERVALIHCYYLDLSNEEAADVLDLAVGTLKSQVLRGKQRLRTLLAAWQPEETA
jgi:RNA polymerase sigma-70 factor (ECF subfamily)